MAGDETGLLHPALFYDGLDEYLAEVGRFVHTGLAAGRPLLVMVPWHRLFPLREHLWTQEGAGAGRVEFVDMARAGRNPGRIMTRLADFVDQPERPMLVGEPIWASRSTAEIREATRHEALINLAFAGVPATILCPYDVSGLDAGTLANARRTHPVVLSGGRLRPSPTYTDPQALCRGLPGVLDAVPPDAELIGFSVAELSSVRRRAEEIGRAAGLSEERGIDLGLAVGEALSNSIRYCGGAGTLAIWRNDTESGGAVVVEIDDDGRLVDPLAGRRRPAADADGGRGLWMIHQLCDLVEFAPGVVRMHVALAGR